MLFINIFSYKEYFFPVLLKSIILILRSSPQLLLNKYQNQHNEDQKITFLFTLIEGTLNFRIIITTLITFLFLLTVASIFIYKKGIFGFQVVSNLLFPIQVYLTVISFNKESLSKGEMGYFGLLFIMSFIIILCKHLVFDFRTDSPVIVKSFSKSFSLLSEIIMVLSGVMSFFLDDNTKVAMLLVLLGLNLLKTYILYYYICFESPLIEYTVYLCDPLSWISLLTSFLSLVYAFNTPYLMWGYFFFIIGGIFTENSILRYLIQKKYINFFRNQFSFKPNKSKQKIQEIQQNLIIYLCLLKAGLRLKDKTVSNESFLRFSEQFVHEICTSLIKFQKVISKKAQKTNNNTSTAQSSQKRIDLNVLRNLEFKFENQHQYAQKYWGIIKQMQQLQDEKFKKLRRFVIYTLPQISNVFQARIVYMYYLSHQRESKQQKIGKLVNRLHFIDDLHRQIDYNFVVEQTKNKKIQQLLVQSKKNDQGEVITSAKSQFQYCLKTQLSYGSSFFEEFYIQTVYEQTLQKKFQQFYQTQKQTIAIVQSTHSTVDNLTSKLIQINKIKSQIFTLIEECPQVQSKQFTLQQYILSKYVLKMPYLAKEKIKISQQNEDNNKTKRRIVMDSQKNSSKTLQRVQMLENQGILLMSAVKDKGNIICGTTNLRQVLQMRSGLNLDNNDKNNEMVHINSLILPCWIGEHKQAMESVAIYQKPFHHLGPKYHMKSIISKSIYQVQFTMHFLTSNMNDLLVAMNLKYKLIESLLITKNNQKIFSYSYRQNQKMDNQKMAHGVRIEEDQQHKQGNYLTHPFNYAQKTKVQTLEQMLFGEQYQITTRYDDQLDDEATAIEAATFSSYINEQESQMYKVQTSVWQFTNHQQQKRIGIEKKLNYYRKNKFLFKKSYLIVVGMMVILCALLIILVSVLANVLTVETDNHMLLYQFRHMMQNQYFLTDLKSFNTFLMLFVPLTPYLKFISNASILDFQTLWGKVFVEEINALQTRGESLPADNYDSNLTLGLQFKNLNGKSTTFLFQEQEFQVHYFNLINQLNLSSISAKGTSTTIFPNPYTDLNLAQQSTLNSLYVKSLNRYYEYLQPNGVFRTLRALNDQLIDEQKSKLQFFYTFILIILFVGVISFGILYIRYLNNLCEFTSALFDLPEQTIATLKMEMEEFKIITEQSKKSSNYNSYGGLKSCKTISVKNKTIFIRKSKKNKVIKQIKKFSSFKSNWKEIILLSLYTLLFLVLLYESYVEANTEIELFGRYLSGTSTLAQASGKSINIFSWLMDGILYPSHPLNTQIAPLIDELKKVDLLTTVQGLQPNPTDLELSLFSSWYDNGYMKIIFFDLLQAKRTLMQSFTMSIQMYEIVYSKLTSQPRGTPIDSKLVVQMYKEISHSTQMIRELLNKAQANYFDAMPRVNVYLILNIIANFLFSTLILYWIHTRLYYTTKTIFQETLSFTTIKDLLSVPTLAFHLYESDKQNLFKDSVKNLK